MFNSVRPNAWWAPKDICFTLEQVKWLITVLPNLREGRWMPNPREGAYRTAPSVGQSKPDRSPFESAATIAAEMDARLKACGPDGWLVKLVLASDEDENSLGLAREVLYRRVARCLKYISGWKRKATRYSFWVRVTNYRHKKTLASFPSRSKRLAG